MRNPNERCVLCNLFMSYYDMDNSSVVWEEDEWAHLRCWNNADEKFRQRYAPLRINKETLTQKG